MFNRLWIYIYLIRHFFTIFRQLVWGASRLARLKYAPVTIFGGARLPNDSKYLQQASALSRLLAEHEIPVLTGGGPGIMEAAMCAVDPSDDVITTMAVWVKGLSKKGVNQCAQHSIVMDYYFARKMLLVNYSIGFAVFPGGFGTLDELLELLTLIQTKLRKPAPIVLIGKAYWRPFMDWIEHSALQEGLISPDDAKIFSITDDIQEAFSILHSQCHRIPFSFVISNPSSKHSN